MGAGAGDRSRRRSRLRLAAAQLEAGRVNPQAQPASPKGRVQGSRSALRMICARSWPNASSSAGSRYAGRARAVEPSADRAYRLGQTPRSCVSRKAQQYRAADAIKPDPLFAESMGYVLYAQERFQEAAQAFDTAIARDPDRTRLFRDQAYAHMRSNDNEGALRPLPGHRTSRGGAGLTPSPARGARNGLGRRAAVQRARSRLRRRPGG
jgi:tetratricopeptide (TPR) repeat protein